MKQNKQKINDIISEKFDFSSYTKDEQKQRITEVSEMIMEGSLLRALNESDLSIQTQFQQFIELEPEAQQMDSFILEFLPNFEKIVLEEISLFKQME